MSESTWNDPRITAYVLDELSAEDRRAFELEMEASDEMVAAVEEARGVTDQLGELFAAEPMPPLDGERRAAILASDSATVALAAEAKHQSRSWGIPLTVFAAAAALLLLVGIAPWLNQHEPDYSVTQAVPPTSLPEAKAGSLAETAVTQLPAEGGMGGYGVDLSVGNPDPFGNSDSQGMGLGDSDGNSVDDLQVVAGANAAKSQFGAAEPVPSDGLEPQQVTRGSSNDQRPHLQGTESVAAAAPSQGPYPVDDLVIPAEPPPASFAAPMGLQQPHAEQVNGNARMAGGSRGIIAGGGDATDSEAAEFGEHSGAKLADQLAELNAAAPSAPDIGVIALNNSQADVPQALKQMQKREQESPMIENAPAGAGDAAGLGGKGLQVLGLDSGHHAHPFGGAATPAPASGGSENQPGAHIILSDGATPFFSGSNGSAPVPSTRRALLGGFSSRDRQGNAGRDFGADGFGREARFRGGQAAAEADFAAPIDEGRGPGNSGDEFEPITDNPFKRVSEHAVSTFSVDVDTASYSKVRDYLMRANQLPRRDAVRIEEMVNYFDYDYEAPAADAEHPFAARATITSCPWNEEHRLARISLKGKTMSKGERPPCNLVFLLDTSGSMDAPNKLPLVIDGMQMLLKQLRAKDRVAITVYAGSAGLVLDSVSAKKEKKIRSALTQLSAGGSTNGGAGISLAYQTARDHFITGGVNRVILCTDGDFNVGTTGTDELVRMVEEEAKGGIYLSVLGFGMGNHNDAMLEKISGRGNGNYAFIDTENEARKVLVDQTSGTLVTIAKNVKMQIEFNPAHVSSYRLIGYENRILAKEDFNDDKKDAGEIGAGHSVTAFYELVPVDVESDASVPPVDDLKYQTKPQQTAAADSEETMTLKLRYLAPDAVVERGDESTLVEIPVSDEGGDFKDADSEFRFAAAVAGFGMKLRRSQYAGTWTLSDVLRVAESSPGKDKYELRAEFADLVRKASELMGEE